MLVVAAGCSDFEKRPAGVVRWLYLAAVDIPGMQQNVGTIAVVPHEFPEATPQGLRHLSSRR